MLGVRFTLDRGKYFGLIHIVIASLETDPERFPIVQHVQTAHT
jgi:hypothetical protein